MSQKDVSDKIPIYKLKTKEEVMKYYDEWSKKNKYDKDMVDWNYTGPKETVDVLKKHALNKDVKILDAGCGTGLVGIELKKNEYTNIDGADLSQKLLNLVPKGYYNWLKQIDLNKQLKIKKYVEYMGWDDLNWLEDVHMGYEENRPAVFCRNANGWVTIPKKIKLPNNQQDRDMIARELLVKFQMSPKHPLVDLKKAYKKF